ncbi:MAG: discoidin domain-containing protein, partial [Thermoproteota archaeon]|nr:discoidin domain-containing protein [Thermoproteota archaeon]
MNFRHISLLSTRNYVPLSRKKHSLILMSLLLLTFMFSIKYMTGHEAYSATSCAILPISAVIANGAQSTNPASEAVDNDAATRWSNQGLGSWIRLDLGSEKTICTVDISWFKGNERVNTFEIAVSNDGTSFTTIYSSKSGGKTAAAEKYDVEDIKRRYVKITFKGNTQNDWASINEIDVSGADSSGTGGGSGYHYDPSFSAKGSNFQDVSSASSLQLSKFTVAAWFKTSSNFGSKALIVNKG